MSEQKLKAAIAQMRLVVVVLNGDIGWRGLDEAAIAKQYATSLLSAARELLEAYDENKN